MSTSVETLVAEGKYEEAARAARKAGELTRAAELYERIWDFAAAAQCARDAGDIPRALRNLLDARDVPAALALAAELEGAGPEGARAALAVLVDRRRYGDAGQLAERLGEDERAMRSLSPGPPRHGYRAHARKARARPRGRARVFDGFGSRDRL